jgi:hypothetical protein
MTDAAVVADSAPAPDAAPAGGAAINENAPAFNSPLGSQIPPDAQAKPEAPAKPASLDDSIERAMAKSAAKQAEAAKETAKAPEPKADAKADAKTEAKAAPERGEGGKFVAKEPVKQPDNVAGLPKDAPKPAEPAKPSFTASEAPSRFSDDAKKEWATAPESVRRETERAIKELTDGFQKYKQSAERDQTLHEFHEMAKASGKELSGVVREYVNMENTLRTNLLGGLDTICQRMGVSLRDVAAHVMGQRPEEQASQQDAVIRELRQELAAIKQQVGGVTQTIEQQREQATLHEINKFASEHPRFEELAEDIAFFMKSGRAKDLPEAYDLAERLNPAPAGQAKETAPAASSAAPPEPPVHPDKGQKSINGAPSAGSSPAAKKRTSKSLDEALERAFGAAG